MNKAGSSFQLPKLQCPERQNMQTVVAMSNPKISLESKNSPIIGFGV